jgi:hypothetical protein
MVPRAKPTCRAHHHADRPDLGVCLADFVRRPPDPARVWPFINLWLDASGPINATCLPTHASCSRGILTYLGFGVESTATQDEGKRDL